MKAEDIKKQLQDHPWIWIVVIIGMYIIVYWLYVLLTRFKTDIIVQRDITKGAKRGSHNLIATKDGRIFQVQNHALILFFRSAEVLVGLENGKMYRVKGYGRRVPMLGMYPQITGIVTVYP